MLIYGADTVPITITPFIMISSRSGAKTGDTQSAGPLEVDQSPSPSPPPLSETADGDSERSVVRVADKPYSVFTDREKWFIVGFASLAALFR